MQLHGRSSHWKLKIETPLADPGPRMVKYSKSGIALEKLDT